MLQAHRVEGRRKERAASASAARRGFVEAEAELSDDEGRVEDDEGDAEAEGGPDGLLVRAPFFVLLLLPAACCCLLFVFFLRASVLVLT